MLSAFVPPFACAAALWICPHHLVLGHGRLRVTRKQ